MEITYRNTPEDLHVLVRQRPLRLRLWYGCRVLAIVGLLFLPGSIPFVVFQLWIGLAILWGVLGVFLIRVLFLRLAKSPLLEPSKTIRLHRDYWYTESNLGRRWRHWITLKRLEETEDYLLLYVDESMAFVIPKAAFATWADAESFAHFVRQCRQAAVAPPPDASPNWPDEPGLGDEKGKNGMQISYRNTLSDWKDIQQLAGKRLPRLPITLILMLLGLSAVSLLIGNATLAKYILSFAAVIVCIPLAGRLAQRWLHRQWQSKFDPRLLDPVTVAISPQGVAHRSCLSQGICRWPMIHGVQSSDRLIAFVLPSADVLHVVPKTAFDSPQHAEEFYAFAAELVKQHAKAALPDDEDADSAVISDSPAAQNYYPS